MCTKIETIEPYIRPPWWTPITKIKIETTKVDAKDQHNEIQMHLDSATMVTIYTNGSGIESQISTAAYNSLINEVSHQYLGSEKQFNVYAAELTALHLAIK